jgi:LPXTG-site transpeptidase (sortase) family protein
MSLHAFEVFAWSAGIALLAVYGTARLTTSRDSELAMDSFEQAQAVHVAANRSPRPERRTELFPGTSSRALDRGAGHIEGTDSPGGAGNVGLAAHRDGFFRALKDAHVGQTIYLDLLEGTVEYQVYALDIVEPTDVGVLADVGAPRLTLVTCYPFYFVGPAPKRFIVRAERKAPPREDLESALAQATQRREATQP